MGRGRKNYWDELNIAAKLDSIRGWAMNGSTDEEICAMLGVKKTTFYEWKRTRPEFAEAIKKGKHVANGELLNSAFRQSIGFKYKEQQAFKVKAVEVIDGKAYPVEKVVVVEVERFAQPDPTMSIFMLKNRLPEEYKDRKNHEITGQNGDPISLQVSLVDELSPEERRKLILNASKRLAQQAQDNQASQDQPGQAQEAGASPEAGGGDGGSGNQATNQAT